MREFIFVVKKWSQNQVREVPGLKLPVFKDDTVEVLVSDDSTIASAYADKTWDTHLLAVPTMSNDPEHCNRPLFEPSLAHFRDEDWCCVQGEVVRVKVQVVNPLQLDIVVKQLRLVCKLLPLEPGEVEERTKSGQEGGEEEPTAAAGEAARREAAGAAAADEAAEPQAEESGAFECGSFDLPLAPGAKAWVELPVLVRKEGTLVVEGVTWSIQDVLNGMHRFELPPLRSLVRKQGRVKEVTRINKTLVIPVRAPLPRLSVTWERFPKSLLHGECYSTSLRLENVGHGTLCGLQIKVSHPSFVAMSSSETTTDCLPYSWSDGLLNVPGLVLQPGGLACLPVMLRGSLVGMHQLGLLLRYVKQMDPDVKRPPFRLAHLSRSLTVTPLLDVNVVTRPSFSRVDLSILCLELRDLQSVATGVPIRVHQVGAFSSMWCVHPLGIAPSNTSSPGGGGMMGIELRPSHSACVYVRGASIMDAHAATFEEEQEEEEKQDEKQEEEHMMGDTGRDNTKEIKAEDTAVVLAPRQRVSPVLHPNPNPQIRDRSPLYASCVVLGANPADLQFNRFGCYPNTLSNHPVSASV